MKFSDGLWMARPGIKLHMAHKLWQIDCDSQGVRAMVPCCDIQSVDDTTRGPCLWFTFTAPGQDMIEVTIEHHRGGVRKGPDFELNREKVALRYEQTEDTLTMINGAMRVVIEKKGYFAFRFYHNDRLLTMSGNRGTAYITDSEYEADLVCDYNDRPAPARYRKQTYLRERLQLDVGETIYGLGERFTPLVKNGQVVDIWNRDGGSCSDQAYKNVPFYLSSLGYGVLVNTPDRVDYEIGVESVRHVQFSVGDERLSYIVIGGDGPKEVLSAYTALIGRSPVPPAWSFGLWLSTSWMPDSDEKITMDFVDGMLDRGIPLSVFHFDARWMDDFNDCDFVWSKRYGDARAMLQKIHDRGVKVCVWINPYVSQNSRLFEEGRRNGYLLKNKEGGVWQTDVWMPGMGIVDFTNPKACEWYAGRLGEIIDMGVDCIKTDFAERIPTDVQYYDGSDPRKMHNYYTYLYNQCIYGMLKEKLGERDALVFARSATVGTQKFPVNWGGDNEATYISMAETLRGGLSLCQSGYGFFAHDISGFVGTATPDLYKRWVAFGLLSTHSRLHGQSSYRVPWCFDEESCDVLAFFTKLKCSLMPYIFEGAVRVSLEGQPEMRAMVLDFQEDLNCRYLDKQYMLGERLLVAPVFRADGGADVYLPDGVWTDYLSGEVLQGGRWVSRRCDYRQIPLFVRENSLIATGACDTKPDYDYAEGATYRVVQLQDGHSASCKIYDVLAREAVSASVARTGDTMVFQMDGRDAHKAYSLLLVGLERVRAVSGGRAVPEDGGVRIIPDAGAVKLTIEI